MINTLKGTGVALITPFTKTQEVDFEALERMTRHVIDGGVDFIVALGTTAETATLSREEQAKVLHCIEQTNAKRVPMVLGFGGNNTGEMLSKIGDVDKSQYCALLIVTPYYNKPSQSGLYAHYLALAKASPLPIILYNVPSRTGVNMTDETTLRLARDFSNIIAIKEASGSMEQTMRIIKNRPEGFAVFSGDDALAVPLCMMGADGLISVLANSHPKECSDMIRLAIDGQIKKANEIHYKVLDLITLLFAQGNPVGVKSALHSKGICTPHVRLPLVDATAELESEIKAFCK